MPEELRTVLITDGAIVKLTKIDDRDGERIPQLAIADVDTVHLQQYNTAYFRYETEDGCHANTYLPALPGLREEQLAAAVFSLVRRLHDTYTTRVELASEMEVAEFKAREGKWSYSE